MHVLAASPGALDDGARPVDPRQTPADLVVLSAADSELALLAAAREAMAGAPSLRLWSLLNLAHPFSIDAHLDACAARSRLVVARILGGAAYWRHGLAQYSARLMEAGVPFAALPGDDRPDPELAALSTVAPADHAALHAYLSEGGAANAAGFLAHARAMLDGAPRPPPARPLLRAGPWWPGEADADLARVRAHWTPGAPVVPLVFYRALVQSGATAPLAQLVKALLRRGLNPLPAYVASLKDPVSAATLRALLTDAPPSVVLNATAFATGTPEAPGQNPLAGPHEAPVLQVVLAGSTEAQWLEGARGLSATDVAMNVALPEVDGRILSRAISFKGEAWFDAATQCPIVAPVPRQDRVAFVADLAAAWARLRATPAPERKVALVLANYPDRDGRLANGVGLDTPASTVAALRLMAGAGYRVEGAPEDGAALMARLLAGPTNAAGPRSGGERLPLATYRAWFDALPWAARSQVLDRWGPPESDPFVQGGAFVLAVHRLGNAVVAIQPARGYGIDPKATYHAPDLVPPHGYLALYLWLRENFGAHALVHVGKHGNLEWLPGKALALSAACWPEVALGPLPHLAPFIVNDPGEGTQAKRRAQAVILDHLTPPLTRAETYGPLRDLEVLLDEFSAAQATDPRRAAHLRREIVTLAAATGLAADAGMADQGDVQKLDAWLCDVKEAQIRDGLHVFGASPEGPLARDLALALARVPRGPAPADASLPRALAADLGLGLDPLAPDMAAPWAGPRPEALATLTPDPWRTEGDTVERLELLSQALLDGRAEAPGPASAAVLADLRDNLAPRIAACGPAEGAALLAALAGRAIPPGPSGAPTRGRPDVLPTGRNFFSADPRALPTRAAMTLGRRSADLLLDRHLQDQGDHLRALLLTAWGTSCMRTGGDDVAQALALMGVQPTWEAMSGRVTGFEVVPLTLLGRPRVDVTLRVSGFFRDAFPALIALVDSAARAVQALDEAPEDNPAARAPGPRVYGSKPGAYGAGLQALIDSSAWGTRAELGESYLDWGGYAYGAHQEGVADRAGLAARLARVEAIVQNQDNREHDLLDSDDYYQFEGGALAAVEALTGRPVPAYHNDHSRPERPVIRTLDEEVARVVRSRLANPKWIAGVMRHGYKGAFEVAASVDYLFAFAATTGAVRGHHFDAVEAATLGDDEVRAWMGSVNAPALHETAQRLQEAIDRGLWTPRSNSARMRIAALAEGAPPPLRAPGLMEARR